MFDLNNIEKEAQRLTSSLKSFNDRIDLYCSSDSNLGIDSKVYLQNKDHFHQLINKIMKITDNYIQDVVTVGKNVLIINE